MTVYVIAHKKFHMPDEGLDRLGKTDYLVPLLVGAKGKEDLGYERDDEGDNISEKNPNYCELTGIYQIWKNRKTDIVGICHYRRFFCDDKANLLKEEEIRGILDEADIIVSEFTVSDFTMRQEYEDSHEKKDLDILIDVVGELAPDYLDTFNKILEGYGMYIGNMMICRWEIFDAYCSFLFPILFEVEKRVDFTDYNDYQKRIFGFMAERLLTVWVKKHTEYRVSEKKIGITGDKSEKTELFATVQDYLDNERDGEALEFCLERTEKRPDLVEDMTGVDMEVLMLINVLKIAAREKRDLKNWQSEYIFNYSRKIPELIKHYTNLYSLVHQIGDRNIQALFIQYVRQNRVSAVAVYFVVRYGNFNNSEKTVYLKGIAELFSLNGMPERSEYILKAAIGK